MAEIKRTKNIEHITGQQGLKGDKGDKGNKGKDAVNYTIPNGEFEALKEDVAYLKRKMSEINDGFLEIRTALIGSEYHERGWLDRIRKSEEDIYKLKKLKWTVYGSAVALGVIFSILTRVIITVI